MIYMVDVDGTICNSVGGDYANSSPRINRINFINDLYDSGHTIIYWTARGGNSGIDWSELTREQLGLWGCKYHELRMKKPVYDVWVDDKAFNDKAFFPL